ncbi:MAG: hypothetical protein WA705_02430 [Candidatus Ozemobacteraceae bacterium]
MGGTRSSGASRVFSVDTIPLLSDHLIEGTPFVPFALLVEELLSDSDVKSGVVAPASNALFASLENVELVQPVMLRRNRPKDFFRRKPPIENGPSESNELPVSRGGDIRVELVDTSEKTLIRGLLSQKCEMPPNNALHASDRHLLLLSRDELYPDLFFHGPTFQADFKIWKGNCDSLIMQLSGLADTPASPNRLSENARRAIIPTDLALQVAALHAMCFSKVPLVPWGCLSFSRKQSFPAVDTIWVSVRRVESNMYDIDVLSDSLPRETPSGEPPESLSPEKSIILALRKVRFCPIQRKLSEEALSLLSKVRDSFEI